MKNRKKIRIFFAFFFFGVEKSKVANRLKRVFPNFEAGRSHVRGVNGRSKFDFLRKLTPLSVDFGGVNDASE